MANKDLISQMVDDTIEQENCSGGNLLPFEIPTNTFTVEAVYNDIKKCFMITANDKSLEIPKNWGPFKNRIATEIVISKNDDNYLFLNVFSVFLGQRIDLLKVDLVYSQKSITRAA
jgi:hypothetical protein